MPREAVGNGAFKAVFWIGVLQVILVALNLGGIVQWPWPVALLPCELWGGLCLALSVSQLAGGK